MGCLRSAFVTYYNFQLKANVLHEITFDDHERGVIDKNKLTKEIILHFQETKTL